MSRRTELKKLEDGQEFPSEFWNYLVNPITGYPFSVLTEKKVHGNKYIKQNNGL